MSRSFALPALAAAALAAAASLAAAPLAAQSETKAAAPRPKQEFVWPDSVRNRQVLPADMGGDRLRRVMVGFSQSLGVRCTYCHVGSEGAPLAEVDFVSDANPRKDMARGMLRMMTQINRELLPAVPGLSEPQITCYTCHRGATEPARSIPQPSAPSPAPAQPVVPSGPSPRT